MAKVFTIVDLDNTVADTNALLAARGIDISCYPANVPDGIFVDGKIFSEAPLIRSIAMMVRILAAKTQVLYLTSRPSATKNITIDWLKKQNLPNGRLIFTEGKSKGEWLKVFQLAGWVIDAIIEDAPAEIEDIRIVAPHALCYVPLWPYNAHMKGVRFLHRFEMFNAVAARKTALKASAL